MVVVKVCAGGICDAWKIMQDERDAACRRDAGGRVFGVKQVEDAGNGFVEREGHVDGLEEGGDAGCGEVSDLEAEEWFADGLYVGSLCWCGQVGVSRAGGFVLFGLVSGWVSDGNLFDRWNDGNR